MAGCECDGKRMIFCPGGPESLGSSGRARRKPHWIAGSVSTPAGDIPLVSPRLTARDILGGWKVRWGIGRMDYKIEPGLYGVGAPDENSPVLVSANFKMSFDRLRKELKKTDAWILVLDTKGINVWCAAGKGTFGTRELVARVLQTGLGKIVAQRTLIVPQLGAVGVAAHTVQQYTGFKVVYGPVRAADLPAFLQNGMKATPEMRAVRFGIWDRLVLIPVELVNILKPLALGYAAFFIFILVESGAVSFAKLLRAAFRAYLPFIGAVLTGVVLTPALLPWIPGRAFAWKGWLLGALWALVVIFLAWPGSGWRTALAYLLTLPAISAFLALNFTGCSSYTSRSGVLKEIRYAVPAVAASAGAGLLWWAVGLFLWG